ncbi:hypothetical protein SBV1_2850019 [Verrucomicrobia bacterium]|nr:hypothetical protein SBV1_2850019 [Verrucomicrobiota bacterium]
MPAEGSQPLSFQRPKFMAALGALEGMGELRLFAAQWSRGPQPQATKGIARPPCRFGLSWSIL